MYTCRQMRTLACIFYLSIVPLITLVARQYYITYIYSEARGNRSPGAINGRSLQL